MEYNEEQIKEIQKLQKTIRQLEGILRISRQDEQKRRVSKDLSKYRKKLEDLCPEGVPDLENLEVENGTPEDITEKKYPTI